MQIGKCKMLTSSLRGLHIPSTQLGGHALLNNQVYKESAGGPATPARLRPHEQSENRGTGPLRNTLRNNYPGIQPGEASGQPRDGSHDDSNY